MSKVTLLILATLLIAATACDEDKILHGADSSVDAGGGLDAGQIDLALDSTQPDTGSTADSGPDVWPTQDMPTGDVTKGDAKQLCKKVFLSSTAHAGTMGGASGADTICNNLAKAAKLTGTFKAWISTATSDPNTTFNKMTGWCLVDGTLIATSWTDLRDGKIGLPINLTEKGKKVSSGYVWTGTLTSGYKDPIRHCDSFTDGTSNKTGMVGKLDRNDLHWTSSRFETCDRAYPIYCFEQ